MDHERLERLSRKIAEEANTCCHQSDGYEEHLQQVIFDLIWDALKEERHHSRMRELLREY